jgi:hypothetical protein
VVCLILMSRPPLASALGFVAVAAVLLLTTRDRLVLDLLMLLRPIESIKRCQLGF